MLPAAQILDRFRMPYKLTTVSAHRMLDRLLEYARSAAVRGLRVIVAGARGAVHLPGMVAVMTALPVIGVPVKELSRWRGFSTQYCANAGAYPQCLALVGLLTYIGSVGFRW